MLRDSFIRPISLATQLRAVAAREDQTQLHEVLPGIRASHTGFGEVLLSPKLNTVE